MMKLLERLVAAVAGLTHQMQGGQAQQLPPLDPYQPDLGPYHLVGAPSVAAGAQAQLVDRSLMHQYDFNQAESQRAAGAAVDMDSGCAVCLLVQAYAYGPFLNKPVMTAAEVAAAAGAAAAAAVLVHANPLVYSEKERGMAEAFMLRHQSAGAVSRAAQLSAGTAWHRSMCKLAARLQTDADAWAWCGEGLMNVQRFWQLPFIYYTDSDGTPGSPLPANPPGTGAARRGAANSIFIGRPSQSLPLSATAAAAPAPVAKVRKPEPLNLPLSECESHEISEISPQLAMISFIQSSVIENGRLPA